MYSVYKHTSPCGKVYIGITSQNPSKRWDGGRGYKNNQYFSRAISKYGWENFSHEVVAVGLTKSEAEQKEIELIAESRSNDPKYGYNITRGGECIGKHSERSKALMSQKIKAYYTTHDNPRKGKEWDEAHKARNRAVHLAMYANKENHPMTGTHRSAETKAKISKNHADFSRGKHPKAVKVLCVETGKVYECIADAIAETHLHHISECCQGKRNMCGGYHWRYADVG